MSSGYYGAQTGEMADTGPHFREGPNVSDKRVSEMTDDEIREIAGADTFPLTCEWCKHAPGTHYLICDMTGHGRLVAFICGPCAHSPATHVLPDSVTAQWLFSLTPDDPFGCVVSDGD